MYLINDAFAGPTVEARSGDRIVIEIENGLENKDLSMHWHGLSIRGASKMDGAIGITQQSIAPGDTFDYDFKTEESQFGTFWYHDHNGVQRSDGLYGGLVVHKSKSSRSSRIPDVEYLLLTGDWYHRTAEGALQYYTHSDSFGNEPVPDSILINGAGVFNCSDAVPARPLDCKHRTSRELQMLALDRNQQNVLRVVNVGAHAGVRFALDDAALVPIVTDGGHEVTGRPAQRVGCLQPGERVDLLVQPESSLADQQTTLRVSLDTAVFRYPNSALTATHEFPVEWEGSVHTSTHTPPIIAQGRLDLQSLKSARDQAKLLPVEADTTVMLYALTQKLAHLDNEPRGSIIHTTRKRQTSPPAPLISLSRDQWDNNQLVP